MLRVLDADGLGNQFAEDDLQGGQQEQDQRGGNAARSQVFAASRSGDQWQPGDPGGDAGRDLLLAIDAQHDAGKGDTHLAGSDIVVQFVAVLQDRQQGLGQAVAFLSPLDDACLAGADRRELAGHIEGIDKDHQ